MKPSVNRGFWCCEDLQCTSNYLRCAFVAWRPLLSPFLSHLLQKLNVSLYDGRTFIKLLKHGGDSIACRLRMYQSYSLDNHRSVASTPGLARTCEKIRQHLRPQKLESR